MVSSRILVIAFRAPISVLSLALLLLASPLILAVGVVHGIGLIAHVLPLQILLAMSSDNPWPIQEKLKNIKNPFDEPLGWISQCSKKLFRFAFVVRATNARGER